MDVLMPQLGETVAEGKIIKWFKTAGDKIAPGDNLFEIETDKTSMEVPATHAGVLAEVRVAVGEIAKVGAVVAVISNGSVRRSPAPAIAFGKVPQTVAAEGLPKPMAAPSRMAPGAQVPVAAAAAIVRPTTTDVARAGAPAKSDPFAEVRTPERNYGPARLANGAAVTPLARRLAVESGIDLRSIMPSGPHGRIMARDIGTAIAGGAGHPTPDRPSQQARPPQGPSAEKVKALYTPGTYEEVPLDGMRRTIAARLVEAKQTIPHFYLTADFELDKLIEVREQANDTAPRSAEGKPAYKLSVNDFLIKALAAAMQRVPSANAAWAEDRILYFDPSDLAVAVAVDGGLITPVIRNAETKSVVAISAEMRDLATRAKARRLKPAEYQGGATTISNLGMYGVREFAAIINPPQATIFAIGAAERRPVEAKGGGIRFVTRMTVTVSCDHRVVDGALGAELLATFKGFVEQPVTALV